MDSLDVRKKSRINGRENRSADQVEADKVTDQKRKAAKRNNRSADHVEARRNRFLWLPCSKLAKLQRTAAMRESGSAEQVEADRVRTRQLRAAMRVNGLYHKP
jgi:hypothetical protein